MTDDLPTARALVAQASQQVDAALYELEAADRDLAETAMPEDLSELVIDRERGRVLVKALERLLARARDRAHSIDVLIVRLGVAYLGDNAKAAAQLGYGWSTWRKLVQAAREPPPGDVNPPA